MTLIHLRRPPLPWTRVHISLCGRVTRNLAPEAPQNPAGGVCQTCTEVARFSMSYSTTLATAFHTDPIKTLQLWLTDQNRARRKVLATELRALAGLITENLDRAHELIDNERGLEALS